MTQFHTFSRAPSEPWGRSSSRKTEACYLDDKRMQGGYSPTAFIYQWIIQFCMFLSRLFLLFLSVKADRAAAAGTALHNVLQPLRPAANVNAEPRYPRFNHNHMPCIPPPGTRTSGPAQHQPRKRQPLLSRARWFARLKSVLGAKRLLDYFSWARVAPEEAESLEKSHCQNSWQPAVKRMNKSRFYSELAPFKPETPQQKHLR